MKKEIKVKIWDDEQRLTVEQAGGQVKVLDGHNSLGQLDKYRLNMLEEFWQAKLQGAYEAAV